MEDLGQKDLEKLVVYYKMKSNEAEHANLLLQLRLSNAQDQNAALINKLKETENLLVEEKEKNKIFLKTTNKNKTITKNK